MKRSNILGLKLLIVFHKLHFPYSSYLKIESQKNLFPSNNCKYKGANGKNSATLLRISFRKLVYES